MQSAPTAFQSYAPDLSMDRADRRASKQVTSRHPQTAVALGALAAASVAAGAGFYFWPNGEQQREVYKAEELPMAGVLLGEHTEPPGPSISFSNPLAPPEEVLRRATQAVLRSAGRESPASRTSQVPVSSDAAGGRETVEQELAQATTHGAPAVQRVVADARPPDSGEPTSSQLDPLQTDVEAGPSGLAVALASPTISGRSRLNAPSSTPSSSADARFLPILDGIVALDFGASADRLSTAEDPRMGGQSALSASAPVTSTAPAIAIGQLGDISTEMPAPALAELAASRSFLGGAVEHPAGAGLFESEERDDQPSSLTTDTPHFSDVTQSARLVDEPQEGPGLAGNSGGVSEDRDKDFDAVLSANIEPSLTGAHQLGARSVNGVALARGEDEGLATVAVPASQALALRSSAQPRTAHSGIIREDDRVAFAKSESGGRGAEQIFTARTATVSLASPADRGSEAYADDGANTTTIPLSDPGDGIVQLRLGDLIALLEDRMERPLFVWLSSAESASKYVTFSTLRAAGIGVDYDPVRNHVILSVSDEEGE